MQFEIKLLNCCLHAIYLFFFFCCAFCALQACLFSQGTAALVEPSVQLMRSCQPKTPLPLRSDHSAYSFPLPGREDPTAAWGSTGKKTTLPRTGCSKCALMAREGERERGRDFRACFGGGDIRFRQTDKAARDRDLCLRDIHFLCFVFLILLRQKKNKNPHLDSPCFGLFRSPYQCCDRSTVNQHTHADRKKGLEMTLPQTLTLVPQYTSLSWPRVDTAAALQSPFFPLCHCVCNEMQRRSGSKPVFRDAGQ